MAIDSCDHGEYVVVYELLGKGGCPVCNEQAEKEAEKATLTDKYETLESEVAELQSELQNLTQEIKS